MHPHEIDLGPKNIENLHHICFVAGFAGGSPSGLWVGKPQLELSCGHLLQITLMCLCPDTELHC